MFLRVNNKTREAGMFGDMADTAGASGRYDVSAATLRREACQNEAAPQRCTARQRLLLSPVKRARS